MVRYSGTKTSSPTHVLLPVPRIPVVRQVSSRTKLRRGYQAPVGVAAVPRSRPECGKDGCPSGVRRSRGVGPAAADPQPSGYPARRPGFAEPAMRALSSSANTSDRAWSGKCAANNVGRCAETDQPPHGSIGFAEHFADLEDGAKVRFRLRRTGCGASSRKNPASDTASMTESDALRSVSACTACSRSSGCKARAVARSSARVGGGGGTDVVAMAIVTIHQARWKFATTVTNLLRSWGYEDRSFPVTRLAPKIGSRSAESCRRVIRPSCGGRHRFAAMRSFA